MFASNRKIRERLEEAFGKVKTDSFSFESIEKYFRNKDNSGAYQVLSDKTCNDLDFNELFMFADRTTSKVGQQYLYNTLRTIPSDDNKFAEQEKLIQQIKDNPALRLELQTHLDKISSDRAYFITSLFQDEFLAKPKWFLVIPLLSFTSLLCIVMLPFTPQYFYLLLGVIIVNLIIHYWNKKNLNEYLGSIPQLLILNKVAKELLKCNILNSISAGVPESIKVIDRVRHRMSFFQLEAKLQSDIGTAFWFGLELVKAVFLLEPLLLFGVLKQLNSKRKEIEEVFTFVGYTDTLISIISLRNGLNTFCQPSVSYGLKVLEATGVYHPLIENCVPNSIKVNGKSILLTGSNMSGKTSFIRTIGLNSLTGLTINTCFAQRFRISRSKISSAIRISDDLMNDKSYYFEEVLTIKEMIVKSRDDSSNLFLLDEIFKGTNTIERISAGKAVLSYINTGNNIVFVSTHDIELADLLKDTYELYHFSEQVENKSVDFDFRLKIGKLTNRNAISILEINDYPTEVISEALELSRELDKIFILSKLAL
jgi:hypothetical protein